MNTAYLVRELKGKGETGLAGVIENAVKYMNEKYGKDAAAREETILARHGIKMVELAYLQSYAYGMTLEHAYKSIRALVRRFRRTAGLNVAQSLEFISKLLDSKYSNGIQYDDIARAVAIPFEFMVSRSASEESRAMRAARYAQRIIDDYTTIGELAREHTESIEAEHESARLVNAWLASESRTVRKHLRHLRSSYKELSAVAFDEYIRRADVGRFARRAYARFQDSIGLDIRAFSMSVGDFLYLVFQHGDFSEPVASGTVDRKARNVRTAQAEEMGTEFRRVERKARKR